MNPPQRLREGHWGLRSSSLEESWLLVNLDWLTSWIYEDASGTFCKAPSFLAQLYY